MPIADDTQPAAEPPGRSQLIQSAIRAVAAHGRKGATVRIIADAARVTPGLVVHHFATKDRLFEEADRVVVNRFVDAMTPPAGALSAGDTMAAIADQLSRLIGTEPVLRAYVRRSLLEATASGATIFDQLVNVTLRQIDRHLPEPGPPDQDLRWTATQVVAINLAGLLFEPFLEKWTDQPAFSPGEIARRTRRNLRFIQAGLTDAVSDP